METTHFNYANYATRDQNSVTQISDYPRLLIYSYLTLKKIV